MAEAGDGEAALKAVRETHPKLVILDLMLPVLDGWEVCPQGMLRAFLKLSYCRRVRGANCSSFRRKG